MKLNVLAAFVGIFISGFSLSAQITDTLQLKKEYTSLDEALKEPEKVYRLNLGNQHLPDFWFLLKFHNLQYLSFRNDHLHVLPREIGKLSSLRTLDLSGNNLKTLPPEIANLQNLEELFLNDDKELNLGKSFEVLAKLPKLKALHLEHDGLHKLPHNIKLLQNMESLYLGENKLHHLPKEINELKHLKYLDVYHNKLSHKEAAAMERFGFRIKF